MPPKTEAEIRPAGASPGKAWQPPYYIRDSTWIGEIKEQIQMMLNNAV